MKLKFFINEYEYLCLKQRIKDAISLDEHSLRPQGYHVRSLYFDDVNNSAYRDKQAGIYKRKKYRIRVYNLGDSRIRLEKKEKFGQYISKEATGLSRELFYQILRGEVEVLLHSGLPLLRDFYCQTKLRLLAPKVIVDYEREAYVLDQGNVRITFDKGLQAGINCFDIFSNKVVTVNALEPLKMIMEIKYDDFLPGYVKNLIQMTGHEHSAISKYVICRNIQNSRQRKEIL